MYLLGIQQVACFAKNAGQITYLEPYARSNEYCRVNRLTPSLFSRSSTDSSQKCFGSYISNYLFNVISNARRRKENLFSDALKAANKNMCTMCFTIAIASHTGPLACPHFAFRVTLHLCLHLTKFLVPSLQPQSHHHPRVIFGVMHLVKSLRCDFSNYRVHHGSYQKIRVATCRNSSVPSVHRSQSSTNPNNDARHALQSLPEMRGNCHHRGCWHHPGRAALLLPSKLEQPLQ